MRSAIAWRLMSFSSPSGMSDWPELVNRDDGWYSLANDVDGRSVPARGRVLSLPEGLVAFEISRPSFAVPVKVSALNQAAKVKPVSLTSKLPKSMRSLTPSKKTECELPSPDSVWNTAPLTNVPLLPSQLASFALLSSGR